MTVAERGFEDAIFADRFLATMVARMDVSEDLFKRVFEQARGPDTSGATA